MARRREPQQPVFEDMLAELEAIQFPSDSEAPVIAAGADLCYSFHEFAQRTPLPEEDLRRLANNIRTYLTALGKRGVLTWAQVEYSTLPQLRDPQMEGQAVKVRVLLETIREPLVVSVNGMKHLTTLMTFRELDSAERIESVPTINTDLIQRVERLKRTHHLFDVLATVVLMPTGAGERFTLLVHDMRPSETPLQMIRATHAEVDAARQTLADLERTGQAVVDYLFTSLVQGLEIQGLEEAPELADSLEAMIVQALSDGWINQTSGKVHTLVIGAPAVGKKLLVDAARLLNPVFQEAHPSKATVAGVCSTAVQEGSTWRSKPGYVPLAHRGVFAIQDFHTVKDAQREKLLGLFNMVMEDGCVMDSTAAQYTHPALTSIHLDTNTRSDLFPDRALSGPTIIAQRLEDIQIPMTLLSRFDIIIEIPRDAQRQIDIALAMYERIGTFLGGTEAASASTAWARPLQVLVAFLRHEHPTVTFPHDLTRAMQRKHQDLSEENRASLAHLPWLSDLQTRLTNTVYKVVAAYARMQHRQTALPEDVDRAFALIWRKFDFLRSLSQHLRVPTSWESPPHLDLEEWLRTRFAGQQVRTGEILKTYAQECATPLVRRTLERWLKKVAQSTTKGVWVFPADGESRA
jgi:hypothetical protein